MRFCHRAIFGLILFVIVYSVVAYGTAQPWSQGPIVMAVALAAMFWALRMAICYEVQVVFSPVAAPLILGGIYAIVRYALAEVEPVGRAPMMLTITAIMFFFIVVNDIRHRWQVTALVWVITGLGVVLSFYGLWQVLRGGQWVLGQPQYAVYRGRASGTFFRPADLAAFLHLAFALAGANFLLSRRPHRAKIVLSFACILISGGLFLTFTPLLWAGWLGMLFVLGGFVVRKRGWQFRWLVAGSCILAVVIIAVLFASRSLQHPSAPPLQAWRAFWASALAIGQQNLWIGSGAGMFPWLYPAHRTVQGTVEHCPNFYLHLFAEYGLVGVVLLLWFLGSYGWGIYRILQLRDATYAPQRLSNRYAFAVAGLMALLGLMADAAFDLNPTTGGVLFPVLAVMAASLTCGVHRRLGESEEKKHPGRYVSVRLHGISRFVPVAGLAGLVLLIGTRFYKDYPAALFLRRGQAALDRLEWSGAERNLMRAWKADNRSFAAAEALGDLYAARATWNLADRPAHIKEAHSWYFRVKTLNPYATDTLVKTARLHDLMERADTADPALTTLREALNRDKRNASYHVHLAQLYLRRGQTDQANRTFRIARELGALEILPTDTTEQPAKPGKAAP